MERLEGGPTKAACKGQRQLPVQPVLKLSDGDKPHLADSPDFHHHEFDDNLGRVSFSDL